jgi:hypothetical protein
MRADDNLALLLPDAPLPYIEHARRITTFLRLVRDDAKAARAAAVSVSVERAREALREHVRAHAAAALTDLLRLHLYAELGPDSFLWCGEPERELARCWSELEALREALREDASALPQTPAPNEPALSVCRRVVEALGGLGASSGARQLWRARIERAEKGPAAGERAFEALLRSAGPELRAEVVCGLAECALDRGAVRAAKRVLDECPAALRKAPRVARLLVWCALVSEDEAGARALEASAPVWNGRLPQALLELRNAFPAWIPHLAGREAEAPKHARLALPDGGAGEAPRRGRSEALERGETGARVRRSAPPQSSGAAPLELVRLRRELGACATALVRLRQQHVAELAALDVAPGLRDRLREWKRALEHASSDPAALEHRAIVEARTTLAHRAPGAPVRDALSSTHVQCAAVAPYFDAHGEVLGWLRLEWEHHLAPSNARLLAAARSIASAAEAEAPAASATRGAHESESSAAARIEWDALADAVDSPCAQAFATLVELLGMKTAQRRWWGFDVRAAGVQLVARGGGASAEEGEPGGRRGVLRALRTASLVRYDEPRPELSVRSDSACGLVLPIRRRGELFGLLAIESTRRRDFPEALAQRWLERAAEFALPFRIAQFREWHRAHWRHDVYFGHGPGAWLEPFALAARSNAPVALYGRHGAGKGVVARWLHFAGARAAGELVELGAAASLGAAGELTAAATVVLDNLDQLSQGDQTRLIEWLDRSAAAPRASPRWIVCSVQRPGDPSLDGTLQPALRARLERLQLRVPDLAQRRTELAGLLHVLAQRFAHEEALHAPTFEDEAIALLWRQPWPLNVRELENFVFKVVLTAPGASLRADDVERIARRFGVQLVRRANSRDPEPGIVRAALLSTMNLRGTVNKTRASLYLGWDPDTLVARMNDLGLDERHLVRTDGGRTDPSGADDVEPADPAASAESAVARSAESAE